MTRLALRYRAVLFALAAAGLGWLTLLPPPDYARFAKLADATLRGHLGAAYASDWNQAGPLQLIVGRVLLIGGTDVAPAPLVAVLIDAVLMLIVLRLCRGEDPAAAVRRELLAGASVLLWIAVGQPWNGHPAELLIPIGWLAGLRCQQRGRGVLAAVALGLTAAIAPWGVLAFPSLLAVASFGRALRTGVLAVTVAIGCYLPFVLSGSFALFQHHWLIDSKSLVHLLDPSATYAGWPIRLAQAIVVAGGCGLVGHRTRHRPDGAMLALLTAGLLRVACDPTSFSYYWLSAAVMAVLLVATSADRLTPVQLAPIAGVAYLSWAASSVQHQWIGAVLCLALVGWQLRPERAADQRPERAVVPAIGDDAGHGVPAHA